MQVADLKLTYREYGQYDLHPRNQPIEVTFSRKILTHEFQQVMY